MLEQYGNLAAFVDFRVVDVRVVGDFQTESIAERPLDGTLDPITRGEIKRAGDEAANAVWIGVRH